MNVLKNLLESVPVSVYVNFDGTRAWIADPAFEMEVQLKGTPSRPVAFPAQVLANLLEGADMEIFLKDDQLRVSRPGFLAEVRTAETTPPTILRQIEEPIAQVSGDFVKTFRSALSLGRRNISYTAKVLVEVEDRVKVVATNGYCLHVHTLEAEVYQKARLHLPVTAAEAFRVLNRDEPLTLHKAWAGKALVVESPNARVGLSLADPHYPDYHQAIPTRSPEGYIQAPRKELVRALRRALVVAEARNHAVRLSVREGLQVEALDDNFSPVSKEALPGEGQRELFINAAYLVGALEEIEGDEVHIAIYTGPRAPLVEVKDERFYALISALRTPQNPPSEG